jgi:hypothetical protein
MENTMKKLLRSALFLIAGVFAVNANATLMSVSDGGASAGPSWADAGNWVAGLNLTGFSGWQLPATLQPDASCAVPLGSGSGCIGDELENLFTLEGKSDNSPGPFSNLDGTAYWSSTGSASRAWTLNFVSGSQGGDIGGATAVSALTTSAVPVPAAVWLFGSALGLLGWIRRRRMN